MPHNFHHTSSHRISLIVPSRGLALVLHRTAPAYTAAFSRHARRTASLLIIQHSLEPFNSSMVTALPISRLYQAPPPSLSPPPPHTRAPQNVPNGRTGKSPGNIDGTGCLYSNNKGISCEYGVKEKPDPKGPKRGLEDLRERSVPRVSSRPRRR